MRINILKKIKDNLSKKFDKYDYNFKYRFIWIKFYPKKIYIYSGKKEHC